MRIRSITCFFDPNAVHSSLDLDRSGRLAQSAQELYARAGVEVQTLRLSTTPFPLLTAAKDLSSTIKLAQTLERDAKEHGFNYLSLGPALPETPESFNRVVPILKATQDVFLSGSMTFGLNPSQPVEVSSREVCPAAVRACAEIIHQAAQASADGFTNLRFAALANVQAGGPFFPGSYHSGERPAFALAMECADTALSLARTAETLMDFRHKLVSSLETQAEALTSIANPLAQQFDMDFRGIDFSLAPFPEDWCSLGNALEALGLPTLGRSGSLAAAAFLASTLDAGSWKRAGFNGLMMPVLEDSTLSKRAAQGTLAVQDLLMYSAVCGTGLDTVPLPGESTPDQIYAVLLDVAALALRLNKPLTARLMPIPGKTAGDPTDFNFSYFSNSRVMALDAASLTGLLAGKANFTIRSRGEKKAG